MFKAISDLDTLALAAGAALIALPAAAQEIDASDTVPPPLSLVAEGPGVGRYVADFTLVIESDGTDTVGTVRITHPAIKGDRPITLPVHGTAFEFLIRDQPVLDVSPEGATPQPGSGLAAALETPSLRDEDGMANVVLNGHHIIADGTVSSCDKG